MTENGSGLELMVDYRLRSPGASSGQRGARAVESRQTQKAPPLGRTIAAAGLDPAGTGA